MKHNYKDNSVKVQFQYPLFTGNGSELMLHIEADVTFGCNAEYDSSGRQIAAETADEIWIVGATFIDAPGKGIDRDALPAIMIQDIKEIALDKAIDELNQNYDDYGFTGIARAA